MSMRCLAVLRMANLKTLYAKEPSAPVILALRPSPPLSDAQLRRLAVAVPWEPVMVEVIINEAAWDETDNTFEAEFACIETMPKIKPIANPQRPVPQGLTKRVRCFLSHDI